MPFDPSRDPFDPLVSQPRRAPRAIMVVGAASACLLGGTLGLWARPDHAEVRRLATDAVMVPQSSAQPRRIQIHVDHPPARVAAQPGAAQAAPPADRPPEAETGARPDLLAPKRAPAGLVKVNATAPERLPPSDDAEAGRARLAAARKAKAAQAAAAAERKADAARAAREAEAREARAAAKAAALRSAKKQAERTAEAKAGQRRTERRLAARDAAERDAKASAIRKQEARLADEKRAEKLAEQQAAERKRKGAPKAMAEATPAARAVSAAPACASPDPGVALACGDPALSAAERQLARAYRRAEAAGVPAETLERQQKRWRAARANAALKAPWAVRDIYLARIAELQDQAREAARGDDF